MKPATRTVTEGLFALMKAVILVLGVPCALIQLWITIPDASNTGALGSLASLPIWGHVIVIGVGELWVLASLSLIREFKGALRGRDTTQATSWSARWATAIVALALLSVTSVPAVSGAATFSGRASRATTAPTRHVDGGRALSRQHVAADAPALDWFGLDDFATHALARRIARLADGNDQRIVGTPREVNVATALLQRFGGPSSLDWVDGASRAMWRHFHAAPHQQRLPSVRLARVNPEGIALLLDEPFEDAPWPFRHDKSATTWTIEPSVTLAQLGVYGAGCGRLLPALLPIGSRGGHTYLVNLSANRRLGVLGDPNQVRGVTAGLLVGLRTLPWAEELAVELLGSAPPVIDEQCFHISASTVETLEDLAKALPTVLSRRLEATWLPEPVVVIDQGAAQLEQQLPDHLGRVVGILTAGVAGTENLVLSDNRTILEPFGIDLDPPKPNELQLQHIEDVLVGAARQGELADAVALSQQ